MPSKPVQWYWKNVIEKNDAKRMSAQTPPTGVYEQNDIAYISDGHRHHLLDIYRAQGSEGKMPLIIDIHGGGWYYGDKELNKNYCMSLTKYGFAVADISYRLVPEVNVSAQIKDCFSAINFLLKHGEDYNLDTQNVFLTGDSAGGHLVGMISIILLNDYLKEKFGASSSLLPRAVGFTCPCLEPGAIAKHRWATIYFNDMYGKGYRKNGEMKFFDFSGHVNEAMFPSYFISAYGDMLKGQTKAGYELVKGLGVDAELCFFDKPTVEEHKLEHVFNILYPEWEESVAANRGMCDFFKKHLKLN